MRLLREDHRDLVILERAADVGVSATAGEFETRCLIAGLGALVEPSLPDIPGIGTFSGTLMHSARWDTSWQPRGRRSTSAVGPAGSARLTSLSAS